MLKPGNLGASPKNTLSVAVLGSGNIGTDLLMKIARSPFLECHAFIGRNEGSANLERARAMGVPVSSGGIQYIIDHAPEFDLVFDATSANGHVLHAPILERLGLFTVDLTPAKIGEMCVPAVNISECVSLPNVNMVTCGGQASIPIARAIGQTQTDVDYIEVISSISSKSAGPATRINLDEYIHTTEQGVQKFSGARRTKAVLNLNPADPPINMQTTVFAKVGTPDLEALKTELVKVVSRIRQYVPGYELLVGPTVENGRIAVMVRVKGRGDYLPGYAGNLDIINCAAIAMAEEFAQLKLKNQTSSKIWAGPSQGEIRGYEKSLN